MSSKDLTVKDLYQKTPRNFSWSLRTQTQKVNFIVVNLPDESADKLTDTEIKSADKEIVETIRFRTITMMIHDLLCEYFPEYPVMLSKEEVTNG